MNSSEIFIRERTQNFVLHRLKNFGDWNTMSWEEKKKSFMREHNTFAGKKIRFCKQTQENWNFSSNLISNLFTWSMLHFHKKSIISVYANLIFFIYIMLD